MLGQGHRLNVLQVACVVLVSFVRCEADESGLGDEERARKVAVTIGPAIQNPQAESGSSDPMTRVIVESTGDKEHVTAQVGGGITGDWYWKLNLKGPTNKNGGDSTLASLDGLADSTTLEVGISRVIWNLSPDAFAKSLCDGYVKVHRPIPLDSCSLELLRERGGPWEQKAIAASNSSLKAVCERYNRKVPSEVAPIAADLNHCTYERLASKGAEWDKGAQSAMKDAVRKTCEEFNQSMDLCDTGGSVTYLDLKSKHPKIAEAVLDDVDPGTVWNVGITVSAGRRNYAFASPDDQEPQKAGHTNSSAALYGGVLLDSNWYLELSARHEKVFKGGDTADVCRPIGTAGGLECRELSLAPPANKSTTVAQFTLRRFVGRHFGFGPAVSYAFDTDVKSIRVPLYFLRDKSKGLNGGLAMGWRSDTREFQTTAFIGGSFGYLTLP